MSPRVGLIVIGHPDYQNDLGCAFAAQAAEALGRLGVEIVADGQAYTDAPAALERGRQLAGERLDAVLVWLGTWIECSTAVAAIREFEHLPFALWGFGMFDHEGRRESTGSFVAACVLKGALERMGWPLKVVLGLPQEQAALDAAHSFCRAAYAAGRLKRTRLGLVGYASMSMYPGTFDHVLLRRLLGPEVVHLDTYTLVRRADRVPEEEVRGVAEAFAARAEVAVTPERLLKSARLGAALQSLCREHALGALNVKCQYELSQEYGMTPCVPLSWLADEGVVTGCEGDVLTTVTQCLLSALTGQVVTYGDLLDLRGDRMLLSSCGFAPFSLAAPACASPPWPPSPSRSGCSGEGGEEHPTPSAFPPSSECRFEGEGGQGGEAAVRLCELAHPGFDGIICSCTLQRGPVTFARLVEGRGDYKLVYGRGVGVDTELRQGRFPALEVTLDGDPRALLRHAASQHWALCYGDASAWLEDWCRLAGVEAVRV